MKTLILMRHGHAEETSPDYMRPLSDSGLEQCRLAALEMKRRGVLLDRVLCSSAVRTRRTAEIVSEVLGFAGTIEESRSLYEATLWHYLETIQSTSNGVDTLLFVAHNPSLSDLADRLLRSRATLDPASYEIIQSDIGEWTELGR